RGIEAEVTAVPFDGLTLSGTLGLMDPEYIEFIDPLDGVTDLSGLEFTNTPKTTFSLAGTYTAPLAEMVDGTVRVDYAYRSKMYFDTFNNPLLSQEPYGLLNGRVQFDFHEDVLGAAVSVAFFGSNLTDEHYNNWGTAAAGGHLVRSEFP